MKRTIRSIALLLTICFLLWNCLSFTVFAMETEKQSTEESTLPETGDLFLARLKIAGITVVSSACLLLLMNHRKYV